MVLNTVGANLKIDAGNLFKVDGLIAVITGGGSGEGHIPFWVILESKRFIPLF